MGKFAYEELEAVKWFNGGYTLMTSGLHEEAIEAFTEAIGLDPNLAGFYTMRGYCFSRVENYKLAIEDFNTAIQLERCSWYHGQSGVSPGKYEGCCTTGRGRGAGTIDETRNRLAGLQIPARRRWTNAPKRISSNWEHDPKILILGTFPGEESLEKIQLVFLAGAIAF